MTLSRDYQYDNKTIYGIKSNAARYMWAGYLLFVLASSLLGDTIILIASIKYNAFKLHRTIVTIMQYIAFCDLLVSVTDALPTLVSVITEQWIFGNSLCYLTVCTKYYLSLTNIFLICTMTSSKLLLLKYPLNFGTISGNKAHMLCVASWLAALFPLPIILVVLHSSEEVPDTYFSYRTYHCDFTFSSEVWRWLTPSLAVLFILIPNVVVVVTTIYLIVIARKVARRGRESLKWQGIMTTILTAIVYCISFLPIAGYQAGRFIVTIDDESNSFFNTSFYRIAVLFLFLNTISNFYIYSMSVDSFRSFLRSKTQQNFKNSTRLESSFNCGKRI